MNYTGTAGEADRYQSGKYACPNQEYLYCTDNQLMDLEVTNCECLEEIKADDSVNVLSLQEITGRGRAIQKTKCSIPYQ